MKRRDFLGGGVAALVSLGLNLVPEAPEPDLEPGPEPEPEPKVWARANPDDEWVEIEGASLASWRDDEHRIHIPGVNPELMVYRDGLWEPLGSVESISGPDLTFTAWNEESIADSNAITLDMEYVLSMPLGVRWYRVWYGTHGYEFEAEYKPSSVGFDWSLRMELVGQAHYVQQTEKEEWDVRAL